MKGYGKVSSIVLAAVSLLSLAACKDASVETYELSLLDPIVRMYVSEDYALTVDEFTINGKNGDKTKLVFKSENESVATVKDGEVKAVSAGETYVTVSYKSATAKTKIVVKADEYELSAKQNEIFLVAGETGEAEIGRFTKNGENADEALLSWESSNESVVTVKGGTLTALKKGTATVKATYETASASFTVHVLSGEVTLVPERTSLTIPNGMAYPIAIKEFTLGGYPANESKIDYVAKDSEILSVQDGKILSKQAGETEISLQYGSKTYGKISVTVLETATRQEIAELDETAVRVSGRAYRDDKDNLTFDNVNSGLEFCFYGTECSLLLDVPELTDAQVKNKEFCYLRVYVDDEIKETYTSDVEELYSHGAFIPLDRFGEKVKYTFATGLEEGVHRIKILKASEQKLTSGYRQLKIAEIVTGESCYVLKNALPEKSLKIDFYGDSISCGAGALGTTAENILHTNGDGTQTYAAYTALALNAESSVVSQSGLCVKAELLGAGVSLVGLWNKYSQANPSTYAIDPNTDLVVINLGTNDYRAINEGKTTQEDLTADAVAVLTEMRKSYPKAKFVWCYGMMSETTVVKTALTEAIAQMGGADKGFYYCSLPSDTSGGATHPTVWGHVCAARTLTAFIKANALTAE